MNSLLPILVSLQNGLNAINDSGSTKEPMGQVISDQANPSGYTFARAFSQVFREQEESSPLFNQLQAFVLTENQHDATSQPSLTQKDFRSLEILVGPDVDKKVLSESRAYRIPLPLEASVLPTLDSDALPDHVGLLSTKVLDASFVATNESISDQAQKFSFEQTPLPAAFPIVTLTPLKGTQALANEFLQSRALQAISGEPTLGQMRQDLEMNGNFSGRGQVSLPKVLESGMVFQQGTLPKVPESGLVSQPISQGSVEKHASLVLKQEEGSFTRTIASSVKDVASSVQQVGRLVPDAETLRTPIVQAFSNSLARSPNVQLNPTSPVTAVQAEGPAGFAGLGQTNQISLKSIQGNTSVLNTLAGQSHEHRTVVPADLPGDAGLLGKGERIQTIVETSMKSVGLDPNSGQSLGSGMNHSSNSQSGFQQPSSSPGQGVGLRVPEERGPALPAPALQRLQMDVQLSESQRVQIDVGVQNRQVYAGLVMDHSVLRNLAAQFVPQLENQLAEVDMELQEFSAEVREERERDADALFRDSRFHEPHEATGRSQGEPHSTLNPLKQHEERGLHFVA